MVIGADIEPSVVFATMDHQPRRLPPAFVATRRLARLHRGDETQRKGQIGMGLIGLGGRLDHLRPGEHIARDGVIGGDQMTGPIDTVSASMGGEIALGVHHMRLPDRLARVAVDEVGQDLLCRFSRRQSTPSFGAPDRVAKGLARDRNRGAHIGHRRAAGEKA